MEKKSVLAALCRDLDLYIACLALTGLISITVSGVFMRYFVGDPIKWLEEVQLWFIVWIVFLGAVATARKTGHIAIDAFVGLFPRRLRLAATVINNVVTIVVLAFFGFYAARHVLQMYTNWRITNLLHIPYCLIYCVVPISCLLLILNSVGILLRHLRPIPAEGRDGHV